MIDTHCHLNLPDAFPNPVDAIDEAAAGGVRACVIVGIDRTSNERAVQIAEADSRAYAVVGWHPNNAASYDPAALRHLEELLAHPRVLALGEIGLDFHWDFATREQQERCLLDQLELAESAGVPVVFHCRKAYPDLLELLEVRAVRCRYDFHCFSGTADEARRALDLGGYLGFDGPITYKNARETRQVLASMPRDRILIETDSPYLTPEPLRGKPNKPAYLPLVNAAVASTLGIPADAAAKLTSSNAERFFGLPQ